jgi:hypothetical protein
MVKQPINHNPIAMRRGRPVSFGASCLLINILYKEALMDALTIVTLALFALMVIAWVVLPSTGTETVVQDELLTGAAAPAASAQ